MSISNLLSENHYNVYENSSVLNSNSIIPVTTLPNNTLWINSSNGHLWRDSVDIEKGHVQVDETFSAKPALQSNMYAVFPTTVIMPFDDLLITPLSNGYNTATATYTIPKTGNYMFQLQGEFDCISGGPDTMLIQIQLKLNGAGPPFLDFINSGTLVDNTGGLPGFPTNVGAVTYRSFNAGDTIQPILNVANSGGGITRIDMTRGGSYFICQEML